MFDSIGEWVASTRLPEQVREVDFAGLFTLDLPTTDRDWLIERIGSQRAREAKELEKAARNGRGRK